MSAYRTARSVPATILDPSFYTPMAKDVLAVQSDGLMSRAERLTAYHAVIYRTKLSSDEVFHAHR
jgi:hypothetical protein